MLIFMRNLCLSFVLSTSVPAVAMAQMTEQTAPVATDGGVVVGKVLASGVEAWYGIPYAKAPVQGLRWQPPQPKTWTGVWTADRKMPECIQVLRPHNINHYFGEEATSEDCLYLNIWAPPGTQAGAKLPVVVFIYGGGLTIGSSGSALYEGESLAKKGVIFLNFNYRLGILGFMAHPELTKEQGGHSGNYGFLDQQAALVWVQKNIARFGGDPDRVTLAGQSAGAMSVSAHLFSPLSKGLFHRAFMSSGCDWSGPLSLTSTLAEAEQTGLHIEDMLHAKNLDDMRQAPADRILGLQAEFQVGANNPGVRVGPIVDGYFSPDTREHILQSHRFNAVPLLAESNEDDLDFALGALRKAQTVSEYQNAAKLLYGSDSDAFLALFPVASDAEVTATARRAAQENGLQRFARGCAQTQSAFSSQPVYLSYFVRKHSYAPGVILADQIPATIGAYHTSDIPFWLGTLDAFNLFRPTRSWTEADRRFSAEMMQSLVAFAKTGNPSTARLTWPAWSETSDNRIVFASDMKLVPFDVKAMDWLAAHPAAQPVQPVRAQSAPRD